MGRYALVTLSVVGGILCGLAWTSWCSGLILLVSFIPFLLIEEWIFENRGRYTQNVILLYHFPGMMIFSMIVMGWMRTASITGAICVITGLALLMTLSLWLAHIVRIKAGNTAGFIALLSIWLSYELISLNVNIVSPWMNLGNGLAKDILFIQWYEYTGTSGGTLWILLSNLLLTICLVKLIAGDKKYKTYLIIWLSLLIIPSGISSWKYLTLKPTKQEPSEVLIIQPDIDPFTEKFTIPFEDQLKRVISMAKGRITGKTAWLITPETTVDDPVNLDDLNDNKYIRMIKDLTYNYPGVSVVAGLVSLRVYPGLEEAPTKSARKTDISGAWNDHFNSAFRIDTGRIIQVYHKSKLVPGIEMQFANGPGKLISRILPYLGGTRWGYGMQDERTCFDNGRSGQKIAPIICYESVFGSYVTGYVKNGAEALFIITNDGWWKNTNGYKQHLYYASLRAIETRRPVARAANTGISCIIDIRGKRTLESQWWSQETLYGTIIPEERITLYVKYGDWLLWISLIISTIILFRAFIFPRH